MPVAALIPAIRLAVLLLTAIMLTACGAEEKDANKAPQQRPVGTVEQNAGTRRDSPSGPVEKPSKRTETAEKRSEPKAKRPVPAGRVPVGKGFDFYVLSLSWSPTWCGENDPSGDTEQCAAGNRHGFIVHGLWPQNEKGFPEFCRSRDPDRVPEALGRTLFDLIPSMGLIGHEWRKHGTCSGLSQREYFSVVRTAREKLVLPPALRSVTTPRQMAVADLETAMVAANPGLTKDAIAVTCAERRIEEMRICLDRDLNFRGCREVDAGGCRLTSVNVPPVK